LGKLVQFDKRGRAAKHRPFQPGDGQVVMFTGVRYERPNAPPISGTTTPNPPAKPRRKRG
jgi:hypothetical protein